MSDFAAQFSGSLGKSASVDRDSSAGLAGPSINAEESNVSSFSREFARAKQHEQSKQNRDHSSPPSGGTTTARASGEPQVSDEPTPEQGASDPSVSSTDESVKQSTTEPGHREARQASGIDTENPAGGFVRLNQHDAEIDAPERPHQLVRLRDDTISRDAADLDARVLTAGQPVPSFVSPSVEQSGMTEGVASVDTGQLEVISPVEPDASLVLVADAGILSGSRMLADEARTAAETTTAANGLDAATDENRPVLPGMPGQAVPLISVTGQSQAGNLPDSAMSLAPADGIDEVALPKSGLAQLTTGLSTIKLGETITSTLMASHFKQRVAVADNRLANATDAEGDVSDLQGTPLPGLVLTKQVGLKGTTDPVTLTGLAAEQGKSVQARFAKGDLLNGLAGTTTSAATTGISASELQAGQLTALSGRSGLTTPAALATLRAADSANSLMSGLTPDMTNTLKGAMQVNGFNTLNTSTGAALGISLPDNMLADSTSGIVTAPLLARTDVVSTQAINAPLSVPLMLPAANEAMASNISWMVKEGVQNASVSVMPAGMGPISVKIGIENEQMNVSIVATQGSTRDALEAMLPRLREQLLAQGLDSVRVDISDSKTDSSRGNTSQNLAQERHGTENGQNSERNADQFSERDDDNSGSAAKESATTESGERELSDEERFRLQEILPETVSGTTPIQHGYDLYV